MAKTKFEPLPDRYANLLTEDRYIRILEYCQDFLEKAGEVSKIEDGLVYFIGKDGVDQRFGLDNLIRNLLNESEQNWAIVTAEHFAKFFSNTESNFNLHDFEQVRDILAIRIYPDSYFDELKVVDDLIYRIDFEDTKSTLVFEYPDKFEPVFLEHFSKWGVSREALFNIAMDHLSRYEVQVGKKEISNGIEQFVFFSSSYSACILLDFERNAKMAIGKFGSVVNIPTQGSAFAVPINQNNVPEIIEVTSETINEFYSGDPGPITTNYYWYYNRQFQKFKTLTADKGFITLQLPSALVELLSKS